MTEISWQESLGYLASILVVISILMSSIIRLRWINLMGCIAFCIYGIVINAVPVVISNLIIVFINIYYLIKIYTAKEEKIGFENDKEKGSDRMIKKDDKKISLV